MDNVVFETERLILLNLNEEEIEWFNKRGLEKYTKNEFSIYLKEDGNKIGMVGFKYLSEDKVELRYGIKKIYRNKGYMTEILKGLIEYLFNQGIYTIVIEAQEDNVASNSVAKKLDFELTDKVDKVDFGICNYYELHRKR